MIFHVLLSSTRPELAPRSTHRVEVALLAGLRRHRREDRLLLPSAAARSHRHGCCAYGIGCGYGWLMGIPG
jgi:hypothetical protein